MKIYTKTGDDGTTSLVGGQRVSKCSPRLNAYGTIDELSSNLGLAISLLRELKISDEMADNLQWIQQKLFCIGGALATDTDTTPIPSSCTVTTADTKRLEQQIEELQQILPAQHSFILPGGCTAASAAHVARTVCRRGERECIGLRENGLQVPDNVICFLNRLSDFLFVLARRANQISGTQEIFWK